jgi:acyl carrier protein
MKTFDRVAKILEDVLDIDKENVVPEQNLIHDLLLDSLDSLDMLFRLEREFGIKLTDKDIFPDGINDETKSRFTVGHLNDIINAKLAACK